MLNPYRPAILSSSLSEAFSISRESRSAGLIPPLSSGGCGICEKCTYPDAPCRFPDRAFPSMEACGLVVNDVCKASGIPYNYGPRTMTFTGCVLYI